MINNILPGSGGTDEGEGMKFEIGSYVGTGKHGSNNPNTLTFPFAPKLVWFLGRKIINTYSTRRNFDFRDFSNNNQGSSIVIMDMIPTEYPNTSTFDQNMTPPSYGADTSSSYIGSYSKKSVDGMTLTWYSVNNPEHQFNSENYEYYYAIIG